MTLRSLWLAAALVSALPVQLLANGWSDFAPWPPAKAPAAAIGSLLIPDREQPCDDGQQRSFKADRNGPDLLVVKFLGKGGQNRSMFLTLPREKANPWTLSIERGISVYSAWKGRLNHDATEDYVISFLRTQGNEDDEAEQDSENDPRLHSEAILVLLSHANGFEAWVIEDQQFESSRLVRWNDAEVVFVWTRNLRQRDDLNPARSETLYDIIMYRLVSLSGSTPGDLRDPEFGEARYVARGYANLRQNHKETQLWSAKQKQAAARKHRLVITPMK